VVQALTATLDAHREAGRGAILHNNLATEDHDIGGGRGTRRRKYNAASSEEHRMEALEDKDRCGIVV
jgi:hypothetical protein